LKKKRKYSNWNPSKVEKEVEEWLASEVSGPLVGFWFAEPTAEIDAAMRAKDEYANPTICSNLRRLSLWYVKVGELAIAQGNKTGWAELKRALRYRYWSMRGLVRLWELDTRRRKQARVNNLFAATYYALAVTTQATEEANWLGERMRVSLTDGAFGNWNTGCLASFLLSLYLRSQGDVDALVVPSIDGLEAYAGIFESWSDEVGLRSALHVVAEYHLDHACESDVRSIEFTIPPFTHIPVEVITLEKIRAGLGLETPRIEHELFSTVFCDPPEIIEDIEDPFLDRVVEFLKDAIDP